MIRNLLCIAGGVAIGYYLAQGQLQKARFDGYNEGFEDGKDYYRPVDSIDCEECIKRGDELLAMSDDEFAVQPEVLEAATKAAEAFKEYQGVDPTPSVLTQEMTAAEEREAARQEAEKKAKGLEDLEQLTNPVVRTKLLEAAEADIPTQANGQTQYNQISAPPKEGSAPKKPAVATEVMTRDEFVNSRTDCKQFSVTYFAGDDILAGEQDQVIELEARETDLGEEVMTMLKAGPESWGGGSSLYIRNTTEGLEFDIVWSAGKYVDEVGPIETVG